MNNINFDLQELLYVVADFFSTICKAKEISSAKEGYGFIARSTPKFRTPKATALEWYNQFGTEMPNIVKITKVTKAKVYAYGKAKTRMSKLSSNTKFENDPMEGYEWVVPNIIKRATETGSLQLTLTFKNSDKTKFESRYILVHEEEEPRFATNIEMDFIDTYLYIPPSKSVKQDASNVDDNIVIVRNYMFSDIVAIGRTTEIEDVWNSIEEAEKQGNI